MFNFFIISLGVYALVSFTGDNKSSKKSSNNYPTGYELKRELRNIPIYDYDVSSLNYDLIEEYIFRDYVYNYEKNSGYTRETALRKSLNKYINIYRNIRFKIQNKIDKNFFLSIIFLIFKTYIFKSYNMF